MFSAYALALRSWAVTSYLLVPWGHLVIWMISMHEPLVSCYSSVSLMSHHPLVPSFLLVPWGHLVIWMISIHERVIMYQMMLVYMLPIRLRSLGNSIGSW